MSTAQLIGIGLIIAVVAIGVLMIVFRNSFFVKLTWRYILILLPAILIIAAILLSRKKTDPSAPQTGKNDAMNNALNDVKEQMSEATLRTTIEVTAARQQDQDKLDALKKVTEIEDDTERRKQLAALMG
jgi:hypothetical protein